MKEKSQVMSLDVMIAVGLFLLAVIMLYYFVGLGSDSQINDLVFAEAKRIPEMLSSPQNNSLSFIVGGKVDNAKLQSFIRDDYNNTRESLGIISDFCFYFEDENGNVVPISQGIISFGSEKGIVGGKQCGKE
ncbi:MAG: hypothetical protein V1702_05650 [Candidatus Woesearchaeota archaeon]